MNHLISAIALGLSALPAVSDTLCDTLDALTSGQTMLLLPQGEATCRPSLAMSGVRNMHCSLEFAYRAPAATQTFNVLVDDLTACLGPDATVVSDQSVNHPDSYDLSVFTHQGREYAVSVKDKGALQQTHVFVRIQLAP